MSRPESVLKKLTARLPELEWKLSRLGSAFAVSALPAGLFSARIGTTAQSAVAEIKSDIAALAKRREGRSSLYLARRIQQKINVLVALCHQANLDEKKDNPSSHLGINQLMTRQQWLSSLTSEIDRLVVQKEALSRALSETIPATCLILEGEMGELEKRLTLARERYQQAIA